MLMLSPWRNFLGPYGFLSSTSCRSADRYLSVWLVEFVRFATSASTQEYDTRTFSFGQKREAAFLPLLFSIYLNCATESSTLSKTAAQTSSQYRASRKTEWPGRVSSRPFKADTSFFLRPSADGAPRRAACPGPAAPRLQAPESCLGLPWRSRRVGPAR
jgi:hypothetical protein